MSVQLYILQHRAFFVNLPRLGPCRAGYRFSFPADWPGTDFLEATARRPECCDLFRGEIPARLEKMRGKGKLTARAVVLS